MARWLGRWFSRGDVLAGLTAGMWAVLEWFSADGVPPAAKASALTDTGGRYVIPGPVDLVDAGRLTVDRAGPGRHSGDAGDSSCAWLDAFPPCRRFTTRAELLIRRDRHCQARLDDGRCHRSAHLPSRRCSPCSGWRGDQARQRYECGLQLRRTTRVVVPGLHRQDPPVDVWRPCSRWRPTWFEPTTRVTV